MICEPRRKKKEKDDGVVLDGRRYCTSNESRQTMMLFRHYEDVCKDVTSGSMTLAQQPFLMRCCSGGKTLCRPRIDRVKFQSKEIYRIWLSYQDISRRMR